MKCQTSFGCQSEWVDLLRYTRKIAANLENRNDKVIVLKNGTEVKTLPTLQRALYNHCINDLLTKANDLSIQGSFFTLQNINRKCSNPFLFNSNINEDPYIFVVKARMSLFPTNFTLYLWGRQKNLRCSFGCLHTESMAHVLNGCIHHFKNYYSRRHDRIVEIISNFIKESIVFPLLRDQLESIEHKKPDIHVVNHLEKKCFIVEITVCYDLYLEYACNTKYENYKSLVECLSKNGYDVELIRSMLKMF